MITAADPSDHGTDLSDHFDRNAQPERDLAFSGHFPQVSPERSGACADDVLARSFPAHGTTGSEAQELIREGSELLRGCSGGAGTWQVQDNFVSIRTILLHRRFISGTLLPGQHQK